MDDHIRIKEILDAAGLPADEDSLELLADDIEIAREAATAANQPDPITLATKRQAGPIHAAAHRLLREARELGWATWDELKPVRRIKLMAEIRLLLDLPQGPQPFPWLGPCCSNFRDTYARISGQIPTIWTGGERASPTLKFITACARVIAAGVSHEQVKTALEAYDAAEAMEPDLAAWERWHESELAQKMRELTGDDY